MPSAVPSHRGGVHGGASRHRTYDEVSRDQESKKLYDSSAWRRARSVKLAEDPLCEACNSRGALEAASHVHHIIEVRQDRSLSLEQGNLQSLCRSCHSRLHAVASRRS